MTDAPRDVELWIEHVGSIRVFEYAKRKHTLYLMWRHDGNWAYKSLKPAAERDGFATPTLFDESGSRLVGRALDRKKRWALAQAEAHLAELRSGKSTRVEAPATPLTLGETWELISNPETGQYPVDTRHRREVKRELENAVRILGADLPWLAVNREQYTKLWRTRVRELRAENAGLDPDEQTIGIRGAEITMSRVIAIATWLRDRERIPGNAATAPSKWRAELRSDWLQIAGEDQVPEPSRPRHAPDEYRKLFAAAWEVDPRMGLMYALGAELRAGQVKRSKRSTLELPSLAPHGAVTGSIDYGRYHSPGRGRKRGQLVVLTAEQRADVDRAMHPETGYLRELEEFHRRTGGDYYLFPGGPLRGGRTARGVLPVNHVSKRQEPAERDPRTPEHPVASVEQGDVATGAHINDSTWQDWFKKAEATAGIASVRGRVWYGGRRVSVDLAKESGISREGLQEHGGWSDSQVPDSIYADQEREYAQQEAAKVRAKIRTGRRADGETERGE